MKVEPRDKNLIIKVPNVDMIAFAIKFSDFKHVFLKIMNEYQN